MAFMKNEVKKLDESFMSLRGIVSMPLALFITKVFTRFSISVLLPVSKEILSVSETSDPFTPCLILIMLG